MKPVLGIFAILSWLARCHGVEPPNGHHHHGHDHDAGQATSEDAGSDAGDDPECCAQDGGPFAEDAGLDAGEPAQPSSEDAGPRGDDAAAEPIDAAMEYEQECEDLPTGLYAFPACRPDTFAPGIRRYMPKYELWSDGATKERFIYLPPGGTIDTRNPDRWSFPVGTRIYKQFNVNGMKIETRVMIKEAEPASIDSWSMVSWAWNAEQDRAEPVDADPAAGQSNALQTQHDIPSMNQCKSCHTMVGPDPLDATKTAPLDAVNGFAAIQLNHPAAAFTLQELLERRMLVDGQRGGENVSRTNAIVPGDQDAQAALGYLHTNCGHCHGGAAPKANLLLWTTVGHSSVYETPIFSAGSGAMCECLTSYVSNLPDRTAYVWRLNAGHPELSAVVARMGVRNTALDAFPVITRQQMPPLGTELVDDLGLKQVTRWIKSLDPVACESKICMQPAPRAPANMAAAAGAPAPAPAPNMH